MAINFQERNLLSSLSMNIRDMAMKTSGKAGAYCFGGLNISKGGSIKGGSIKRHTCPNMFDARG